MWVRSAKDSSTDLVRLARSMERPEAGPRRLTPPRDDTAIGATSLRPAHVTLRAPPLRFHTKRLPIVRNAA
jgi:hypothetical protein